MTNQVTPRAAFPHRPLTGQVASRRGHAGEARSQVGQWASASLRVRLYPRATLLSQPHATRAHLINVPDLHARCDHPDEARERPAQRRCDEHLVHEDAALRRFLVGEGVEEERGVGWGSISAPHLPPHSHAASIVSCRGLRDRWLMVSLPSYGTIRSTADRPGRSVRCKRPLQNKTCPRRVARTTR